MDDLIGRLVANAGVDRTAAENVVGIVPQFLLQEGPTKQIQALIQHMPGQDAAMSASSPSSRSPGMCGALHEIMQGKTRSAKSSARSPASASSSDA